MSVRYYIHVDLAKMRRGMESPISRAARSPMIWNGIAAGITSLACAYHAAGAQVTHPAMKILFPVSILVTTATVIGAVAKISWWNYSNLSRIKTCFDTSKHAGGDPASTMFMALYYQDWASRSGRIGIIDVAALLTGPSLMDVLSKQDGLHVISQELCRDFLPQILNCIFVPAAAYAFGITAMASIAAHNLSKRNWNVVSLPYNDSPEQISAEEVLARSGKNMIQQRISLSSKALS